MDAEGNFLYSNIKQEEDSFIEAKIIEEEHQEFLNDHIPDSYIRHDQQFKQEYDSSNFSLPFEFTGCTVKDEPLETIGVAVVESSNKEDTWLQNCTESDQESKSRVISIEIEGQDGKLLFNAANIKQEVKSEPDEFAVNTSNDLYKIIKVRVGDGLYVYECQVCKKKHAKRGRADVCLMNHRGERPFSCKKCGHGFTEICKLRRHMLIHSGEKAHKCETCNKTFALKYNLKKHQLIHEKIRPHVCPLCEKSFTQKGNLTTHMKIHMKMQVDCKSYACSKCGKQFKRSCFLESHMSKKCFKTEKGLKAANEKDVNISETNTSEGDLKCEICDTTFTYKKSLTRHKLKHGISVDDPDSLAPVCSEKCCSLDIVEQSFADVFFKAIRNRKKVHISCFMCNRTLHSPVSFFHHVKTVHSDEDQTANLVACSECGAVIDFTDTIELALEWLRHKCVSVITAKGPGKGTITLQKVIIETPSMFEMDS